MFRGPSWPLLTANLNVLNVQQFEEIEYETGWSSRHFTTISANIKRFFFGGREGGIFGEKKIIFCFEDFRGVTFVNRAGVGPECISHTAWHHFTHPGVPLAEHSTFGSRGSQTGWSEILYSATAQQHLCLLQRQLSTNISFNGPNWKFIFPSLVWPLLDALWLLLLLFFFLIFFMKGGRVFLSLHWESQSHFLLWFAV